MTNRNTDSSSQGDDRGVPPLAPSGNLEQMQCRAGNTILKSGPLSLSSKGIGWTSWKKRWFILTRTSLVFFRSDPSVIPQKGSEVNLTLGGIDLNNSGSVVVKDDKKLLTVHFPDGRDGRAFTLKAETLEDLHEWKAALETALSQAPSSAPPLEQNGILKNDQNDAANNTHEEMKDRKPVKSIVVGRPILLALEDIDGTPSFLEKALRFIEMHGVKVEGILRQAADVDDVEQRVQEYEQGKNEFSVGEDAHVVADCVKHVLRELPSSPVPASCCNALLEACRTDRGTRVNAMRSAICETFPEPNRRLLQRILMMMQTVASHKNENRMSSSAVAACMAPLLLRPLLAGDCELENDFDLGGDGSVQLLQAAAAANHAQAIVITLLEEYDKIFGCVQEGIISSELYSDSEESGSESEEATDDDKSYEDDGHDDETNNSDAIDDDLEHASSRSYTDSSSGDDSSYDDKGSEDSRSSFKSPKAAEHFEHTQNFSLSSPQASTPRDDNKKKSEGSTYRSKTDTADGPEESNEFLGDSPGVTALLLHSDVQVPNSCMQKSSTIASVNMPGVGRRAVWGRTSAKKNLSMESINFEIEDEAEIEKLEATKRELHNRIAVEAKESEILKASLEQQKKALHGRRLALEQEVERLQKQLQKERDIRATLEAALNLSQGPMSISGTVNEKMKADIEEITLAKAEVAKLKEKVDDLGHQLHNQREENYGSANDSYQRFQQSLDYQTEMKDKEKNGEPIATRHPFNRCTRSKDTFVDEAGSQNEKQVEARPSVPCLHNKQPPELQQLDSIHSGSSNFVGSLATSGAESVALKSPATTNNKRHGSKGEGTNSATSTLTKLTNRLNFLKERRTHITNELQNMDKGRSLIQPAQNQEKVRAEALQSVPNMDKVQGLEAQSTSIPERSSRGIDNCNLLPHQCPMPTNLDKEGRLEGGQWVPNLDRVKSEGHSSQKSERGRGSEGAASFPSRTHSR